VTTPHSSRLQSWGTAVALFSAGTGIFAQQPLAANVEIFGESPLSSETRKADVVTPAAKALLGLFGGRRKAAAAVDSAPPNVDGMGHVLQFCDGRQMRGKLLEVNRDEVVWSRVDVNHPLRFGRKDVRRIAMSPAAMQGDAPMFITSSSTPKKSEPTSMATLKLAGADWLFGDVVSADGQTFSLKVSGGTAFDIAREQIAWMQFGKESVSGASLDFSTADTWVVSGGEPVDEKAGRIRFKSNAFVAKTMALPNRFEMAFELPSGADGKETTSVWLQPYTPRPNNYSTGTVQISITEADIERCIYDNGFKRDKVPFVDMPAATDGWHKFRIFYDALDRKISVFKNGKKAAEWALSDDPNRRQLPRGVCVNRERGGDGDLLVGNFRITPWDGDLSTIEKATAGDLLSLPATPTAEGKVTSITGTKLQFSGEEKELKSGTLLRLGEMRPGLAEADTTLIFGRQGEIAVSDFEFREGKLKCRTTFAPSLELDGTVLNSISFRTAQSEPTSGDVLVFKNGDELPGRLKSTSSGGGIFWSTASGGEFEVQAGRVAGIRFGVKPLPKTKLPIAQLPATADAPPKPAPKEEGAKPQLPTLELKNGDRIPGEFTAAENDKVRFKHAILGEREIGFSELSNYFSTAIIDGASGWMGNDPDVALNRRVSTPDRWIELDGSFFTRSSVSGSGGNEYSYLTRSGLKLPPRFELRCDAISFGENEPYFSVSMSSKNTGSQINFSFSYGELNIHGYSQRGNGRSFSSEVSLRDKSGKPTKRRDVRFFVDAEKGSVAVMLNGTIIKKLGGRKEEGVVGVGHTLSFSSYGGYSPTKLSNIWLGPWSGEIPDAEKAPSPTIALTNGDSSAGRVLSVRDGSVKVETEVGEFELPFERIGGIGFGGEPYFSKAAGRIRLRDGAVIHADEFRWEGESLAAKSATLGSMTFSADDVAELIIAPPARGTTARQQEPKKQDAPPAAVAPEGVAPQIQIELVPAK
jgi:hypothetical protein